MTVCFYNNIFCEIPIFANLSCFRISRKFNYREYYHADLQQPGGRHSTASCWTVTARSTSAANTMLWANAALMPVQRLRRWPGDKAALALRLGQGVVWMGGISTRTRSQHGVKMTGVRACTHLKNRNLMTCEKCCRQQNSGRTWAWLRGGGGWIRGEEVTDSAL